MSAGFELWSLTTMLDRSMISSLLEAADLPAGGLVQLRALLPELWAEEAVDEDVGGRVHDQQDVADADGDQGPGRRHSYQWVS